MCHSTEPDKFLKILCDKLRAVIGDDSGFGIGKLFSCPLQDNFDIRFFHCFTDFPVDNIMAKAVQYAAQVVKCAADVNVRNIDMPLFMGL